MYFKDHNPPHFHVRTPDAVAQLAIDDLRVIEGDIGRRALAEAREWAIENRLLLTEKWNEFSS